MEDQIKLVLLIGTVRAERLTERVSKFVTRELSEKFSHVSVKVFDVRYLSMPMDDDGPVLGNANTDYKSAVREMDALLIVSPEYNHSFPGTLKRALDMLDIPDCLHKAVGVVGVSNGTFGGARMTESLLPVVRTLGLVSIKPDQYFPKAQESLTEDGVALQPIVGESFGKFMTELLWMANTLRAGRTT